MGTLVVVVLEPFVQILLEFFQAGIEFLPESHIEELFFDCSVEAFCESVCLRRGDSSFTVFNTVYGGCFLGEGDAGEGA